MRTLIYKRTHHGDPDRTGQFGIRDCMKRIRAWKFEAVIGVGGVGPEARSHGLDGRVNWIGIGPHRTKVARMRGPIVTFDHFVFYGSKGPDFEELAPLLAGRMYSRNVRVLMKSLNAAEQEEAETILDLARHAPPSPARNHHGQHSDIVRAAQGESRRVDACRCASVGSATDIDAAHLK